MDTFIAYRKPGKLANLLTPLLSFTFLIVWLPFLRSIFDGRSYEWGLTYFGHQIYGAGITPSFAFLVIQLVFYAALMIAMYRVRNRLLYHILLILWFVNIFVNILFDIAINGDTIFQGDTLGIKISLTWVIIPLSVLALMLIFLEIRADRQAPLQRIPWANKNRNWFWIVAGLLPLQAILLASGEPHGLTDQIGVLITIMQCFLIPLILKPYSGKS
jgi:hypothetical protein